MKIGILQPGYLPWLGFFEQVYQSDVFVVYDDVQYDKHGWRNRNRIKTAGGVQWLTVPIHAKLSESPKINEVRIDNSVNWRKKHLESIRQSYARAPYFSEHVGLFEEAYSREWEYLVDLDVHFIERLSECLGMAGKRMVRSSSLAVEGDRVERLIRICRAMGADTFYEGASGQDYIDDDIFRTHGVAVEYQDYVHPLYRQLHGEFVPYLSVIDLLFNHGNESLWILTGRMEVAR